MEPRPPARHAPPVKLETVLAKTIIAWFMENLFAPWRLEFITGKREEGCIFCKKPAEREKLRQNLVLYVGERGFVILNLYPYTSGHLLVAPVRHTADYGSLTEEENREMQELLQHSVRVLTSVYRPDGFNLGMNLGTAAGAGIRDHLHWHVVPRWYGDTNFLPVLGDTRTIPELLVQAYDRLRPGFEGFAPGRRAVPREGEGAR
jgi:ATP adenylyltransferase